MSIGRGQRVGLGLRVFREMIGVPILETNSGAPFSLQISNHQYWVISIRKKGRRRRRKKKKKDIIIEQRNRTVK